MVDIIELDPNQTRAPSYIEICADRSSQDARRIQNFNSNNRHAPCDTSTTITVRFTRSTRSHLCYSTAADDGVMTSTSLILCRRHGGELSLTSPGGEVAGEEIEYIWIIRGIDDAHGCLVGCESFQTKGAALCTSVGWDSKQLVCV